MDDLTAAVNISVMLVEMLEIYWYWGGGASVGEEIQVLGRKYWC